MEVYVEGATRSVEADSGSDGKDVTAALTDLAKENSLPWVWPWAGEGSDVRASDWRDVFDGVGEWALIGSG